MKFLLCFCLALSPCAILPAQHSFTIDTTRKYQTITGFGASDAWSNDFLMLMSETDRNIAADRLFSTDNGPDGSPLGIGLSIWRFNIGTGSSEQGDSSRIHDPYRRTEYLFPRPGSIGHGGQQGAIWMLRAARKRGVDKIVMFSNSPPVSITKNGRAFSGQCGESNLDMEKNGLYADYLVSSIKYLEEQNIDIDFLSPVNEPEWGWCEGDNQEGCPWENAQIADLSRRISSRLRSLDLKTGIQVPESGLLLFTNAGGRFRPGRQDHIRDFFSERSDNYIGGETNTARMICAHGYFTEWPLWLMRHVRKKTARLTGKYGIEYWMSEYCILKKTREIEGGGRDLGMKTALYVSRVIHHDLVYGNAAAWCWWLGISAADFKDGLLYAERDGTGLTGSKTLWAMGNFSRFVRPGATRIGISGKYDREFLVSAYRNPSTGDLVIIVINMKKDSQELTIRNLPEGNVTAWETSSGSNLVRRPAGTQGNLLTVSPGSITTFIISQQY